MFHLLHSLSKTLQVINRLFFFILYISTCIITSAQQPGYTTSSDGRYVFNRRFSTLKDLPKFSAWDSLPNGRWIQLHKEGGIAIEFTLKNHLMNGPAKGLFPDGKLRFEFTFYDNFIDGKFKEYYPSGELYKLYHYNQGYLNGEWFIYYKNGQLSAKGYCKDDEQEGKLFHWWPNGNLKEERTYKDNKLDGITIYWYEHGIKMMEGPQEGIDNKVGNWTFWYEDGKKHKEVEFAGKLEKMHNSWDRRGKQMVVDGNGKYTFTSITGKKLLEGNYKNALMDGKWLTWDEKTDSPPRESFYVAGIKQ